MATKTIDINGTQTEFKITGLFPIYYFNLFNRDFLKDFTKLEQGQATGEFDTLIIYNIVYALAKNADKELPSMEEWLDSYEDGFPVFEVLTQVIELIQLNFVSQKKATVSKAKVATTKKTK